MKNNFLRTCNEEDNFDYYYKRKKLSNGQFVQIEFQEAYQPSNFVDFNINLVIHSKKKKLNSDIVENQNTGHVGLEGLLWAKHQIVEFEDYIKSKKDFFRNERVFLSVIWSDNRRRNVYERGLRDLGFKFCNAFNMKRLRKEIIH